MVKWTKKDINEMLAQLDLFFMQCGLRPGADAQEVQAFLDTNGLKIVRGGLLDTLSRHEGWHQQGVRTLADVVADERKRLTKWGRTELDSTATDRIRWHEKSQAKHAAMIKFVTVLLGKIDEAGLPAEVAHSRRWRSYGWK